MMMWIYVAFSVLLAACSSVDATCRDMDPGFCKKYPELCHLPAMKPFMTKHCKKTCGWCSGGPETEAPVTRGPLQTREPHGTYPKPFTGKCGQPEVKGVRVVAGTTPPRGAWPWQILLSFRNFPMCGGTLISPQWVVTAAHCVYGHERNPGDFSVRVGEFDRTKEEGSEVDVVVEKVIRHRQYSQRYLNNDIALLKLSKPVKFNKYVQPACLPTKSAPVKSQCYITGWGKTHHPGHMTMLLQQGLLPVVSNKVCYEKNHHRIPIPITSAMICGGSGGTSLTQGCHGDSGGPFVCHIDGRWELQGSVSHGSPVCKSSETYTVFSRTFYFKEWIKQMVATN